MIQAIAAIVRINHARIPERNDILCKNSLEAASRLTQAPIFESRCRSLLTIYAGVEKERFLRPYTSFQISQEKHSRIC